MDLVPYYGEAQLSAANIRVRIRPSDRQRAQELLERTAKVTQVTDQDSYDVALKHAAELKAFAREIYDAKRAAKRPFEAVNAAIEDLAKGMAGPIDQEQERIVGLFTGYVRFLEQKQKEEEKALRAKLEAEERAHQEAMRKIEAEKAAAEAKARAARTEVERLKAEAEAARRAAELANAELLRDLEVEVRAMNMEPAKGVVPGGRVTHPFKFKLRDPEETVKAGCKRLLRIELDIRNCEDAVRLQLEIAPDKVPTLPGIEVSQETHIAVKAASRIS